MASIKRREDGKWRARYRDESAKEHARHFERKIDAQRWLDEVTAAVVTGQYVDPKAGRVTFSTYYKSWAPRQVWVSGTVTAMGLAAGSVTFGDVPLNRLRRSHLEQWVKHMETKTKPLKASTIHTRVVNVRSVLKAAVRDKVIATDPSDGLALPRQRRREASMVIPTSEQVGAIMTGASESFKAFVAIAAFAGLRLGEVAALQVGDVDFLRRVIHVRRQVQRANGGKVEIRAPKYGSERDVYVPEQLTDMISVHIAKHCAVRPAENSARHTATDVVGIDHVVPPASLPSDDVCETAHVVPKAPRWLFSEASSSDPWHQNTVGYYWRKACAKAKVEGFTLHDARHYYASGLIAAGCDVVTVQRALGHSKATTTLNTYSHLWPTAEDRTRSAAQELMESAAPREGVGFLGRLKEPPSLPRTQMALDRLATLAMAKPRSPTGRERSRRRWTSHLLGGQFGRKRDRGRCP